jgi:hypothetical protein
MQPQYPVLTTGWRRPVWIALLVASSLAFSLGFACATPFAAFAAIAALTMPRRDALLLIGLVWLANQAVGFSLLHYPWTANCLAWGIGLGLVSVSTTCGAEWGAQRMAALPRPFVWAGAFVFSFAIYEGLLFAASVIVQSGVENYTAAIVGRIFSINAAAFLCLLLVNALGVSAGLAVSPTPRFAGEGRHS